MVTASDTSSTPLQAMWGNFVIGKYADTLEAWKKLDALFEESKSQLQSQKENSKALDIERHWKKGRFIRDEALLALGLPKEDQYWRKEFNVASYWELFAKVASGKTVDLDLGQKTDKPEIAIYFYDKAILEEDTKYLRLRYMLHKGKLYEKISNQEAARQCYYNIELPFAYMAFLIALCIIILGGTIAVGMLTPFGKSPLGTIIAYSISAFVVLALARVLLITRDIVKVLLARLRVRQ